MLNVSKKILEICQTYSNLTISTPKITLFLLFLIWFLSSTVIFAEFKQINDDQAWENIVSHNIFVSVTEKCILLWVREIYCVTCFHPYSHNVRLLKDKFSQLLFKKISWTLYVCIYIYMYNCVYIIHNI